MGPRRRDRQQSTGQGRGRNRGQGHALELGWGESTDPSAAPTAARTPPPAAGPRSADGTGGDPQQDAGKGGGPRRASAWNRLSRRTRRLLAGASVLLLVAALVLGLPRLLTTTGGPEAVATDFLQAIVDGDVEEVREHVEHTPDASGAALTAEILGGAADRLDSFTIDDVELGPETATVTATLSNGSTHTTTRLALSARADSAFAPVAWELAPVHLPEFLIDIPLGAQEIRINGVALPTTDLMLDANLYSPQIALQLLPGTYEVTLADLGPWQDAPQVTLEAPPVLGTWRKPIAELQPTLSEAGRHEVQEQVDALPQECSGTASALPVDCPFALPEGWEPDGAGVDASLADLPGTWALDGKMDTNAEGFDRFLWSVWATGSAEFTPDGDVGEHLDEEPQLRVPVEFSGVAYVHPTGEIRLNPDSPGGFGFAYCVDPETGEYLGLEIHDSTAPWGDGEESCTT